MKTVVRLIRSLVIFSLAFAGMSFAPPAQAISTCLAGTYAAPYDSTICLSARPGTFVDSSGATAPTLCAPGFYQPYYGKTSCVESPAGYFVADSGASTPTKCGIGKFQNAPGAISCTPAPSGSYISSTGSTSATTCPSSTGFANISGTASILGNNQLIDCFTFSGNSLLTPSASSTQNDSINLQFNLNTPLATGDPSNQIEIVLTSSTSVQTKFTIRNSSEPARSFDIEIPTSWDAGNYYFSGCEISGQNCTEVASLAFGTYGIEIFSIRNGVKTSEFSVANVTLANTTTQMRHRVYAFESANTSTLTLSGSIVARVRFSELPLAGSGEITLRNQHSSLVNGSVKTRVYKIATNSTESLDLVVPLTGLNSSFVQALGDDIEPGLWWLTFSYRGASGSKPSVSETWDRPFLVVQNCQNGTFSVDGIRTCINAPAGYFENYPADASFDRDIHQAFFPTPCAAGTFQPFAGGASCLPAEAGYYTNTTGNTVATPCTAGSYQAAAGQTTCVLASANHFVASSGQISQTPCPSGYSQPTSGSTSCVVTPASATPIAPIVCPALTFTSDGATSSADCKPRPCVVAKGKSATSACMLESVAQTLPAKAKVSIKMNKSFKKTCKVSGSKVKALKAGTCTVTLTVKPKKGKSTKYTVNVTGT